MLKIMRTRKKGASFLKIFCVCIITFISLLSLRVITSAEENNFKINSNYINAKTVYDVKVLPEEQQSFMGMGSTPVQWGDNPTYSLNILQNAYANLMRNMKTTATRININPADWMDENGELKRNKMEFDFNYATKPQFDSGLTNYELQFWNWPSTIMYYDDNGWGRLKEESEDTLCDFYVKILNYMFKENNYPKPSVISLMNEPNARIHYQDPEQYARLHKKAKAKFVEAGYGDIPLSVNESAGIVQIYAQVGERFSMFEKDPEFKDAIDAFTYHSYYHKDDVDIAPQVSEDINKYFNDKPVWQTEISSISSTKPFHVGSGNYSIDTMLLYTSVFAADFLYMGVNNWLFWLGASSAYLTENGSVKDYGKIDMNDLAMLKQLEYRSDNMYSSAKNPTFNVLSTLSNNIDVGSKVHRVSSNDPAMENPEINNMKVSLMVAFENKDKTVVLINNPEDKEKYYNISNLKGISAEIYTIALETWRTIEETRANVVDNTISEIRIPPYSSTIIVADNKDIASPKITLEFDNNVFFDGGVYYSAMKDIKIKGFTDEKAEVYLNGSKIKSNEDNTFYLDVNLLNSTRLLLKAVDKKGNVTDGIELKFEYNPNYNVVKVLNTEFNVSSKEFIIFGCTNKPMVIKCGEHSISTDENFNFRLPVVLLEGNNHFDIIATEVETNNVLYTTAIDVFCDTVSPEITVFNEQFSTDTAIAIISGAVNEKVSELSVNGSVVSVRDDLTFVCPAFLDIGENNIEIKAKDLYDNISSKSISISYQLQESSPHIVLDKAYVKKVHSPITIDGSLDEPDWNLDLLMAQTAKEGGEMTNVAKFGVMWDTNNLYIGVEVQDSKIFYDSDRCYNNDCIELFFNPSNQRADNYKDGDVQLFAGFENNNFNVQVARNKRNITYRWKLIDNGYTVEISVPWKEIGLTASEGLEFGFDISCDNNDEGNGKRAGVINWSSDDTQNWTRTSKYGTLILTDVVKEYDDASFEDLFNKFKESSNDTVKATYTFIPLNYKGKTSDDEFAAAISSDFVPYVKLGVLADLINATIERRLDMELLVTLSTGEKMIVTINNEVITYQAEQFKVKSVPIEINGAVYIPLEVLTDILEINSEYDTLEEMIKIG